MDKNIKNIVFDLGGVLVDLDFKGAINGLQQAGFANVKEQLMAFDREGIFQKFELGEMSADEFRTAIRNLEITFTIGQRSCKRAFFVSEQFRVDRAFGNGTTVHCYILPMFTRAILMYNLRKSFFTDTTFTGNQHRQICWSNL